MIRVESGKQLCGSLLFAGVGVTRYDSLQHRAGLYISSFSHLEGQLVAFDVVAVVICLFLQTIFSPVVLRSVSGQPSYTSSQVMSSLVCGRRLPRLIGLLAR